MAADAPGRQPHVVTDLASRRWKAQKIERLLALDEIEGPLRLLEIGTGTGGIAQYFAAHPSGRFEVDAVDVVDSRSGGADFRFTQVEGTTLPFADASFDVVLSNHVIEHVGERDAQRAHLAELRRVLRPGGRAYLAVPNRWMLVEPHFRLAFLSWLPRRWRSPYLRWRGGGDFYDCEPFAHGELRAFLAQAGFEYRDLGIEALRATFEIERPGRASTRLVQALPAWLLRPGLPLIPTLIFSLRR